MKVEVTNGRRAWWRLAVGLGALSVLACRELEAPPLNQIGVVTVTVADQTNKGVLGSIVTLEVGSTTSPNRTTRSTNDQGLVAFDQVPAGQTTILFADPPTGYTGGGRSNAKSVAVVVGQTVQVSLTLTKTTPAAGR